jgi:hypothetical protein
MDLLSQINQRLVDMKASMETSQRDQREAAAHHSKQMEAQKLQIEQLQVDLATQKAQHYEVNGRLMTQITNLHLQLQQRRMYQRTMHTNSASCLLFHSFLFIRSH